MKSVQEFLNIHYSSNDNLRLGQRFYNYYLKGGESWPKLFYEKDSEVLFLIIKWLRDHNYTDELPRRVE